MRVLNWVYGAKIQDAELADRITEAMRAAHNYRNQLCALERAKRQRHEDLLQRLAPRYVEACAAVTAAEEELGRVREAIQAERVRQQRKTPTGCESLVARANELKLELRELRADRKERKRASYEDPVVREAMAANQQQLREEQRAAKQASGLYWGTEALVKQSAASFGSGAPPRFLRWEGEGQLAVQLQGGLPVEDADEGTGTLFQLHIPNRTRLALQGQTRVPRSLRRGEVWFRIGSENRQPVWAVIPIRYHRQLPEGGVIKWAYLERRMIANHVRWSVRITIEVPDIPPRAEKSWVALHVGWLRNRGRVRAAIWRGSDGETGEMEIPREHVSQFLDLDEIRGFRDREFDDFRAELRGWIEENGAPEWLEERTSGMMRWRSQARLASVLHQWRANRFAGDCEIFERMECWRKRDKHAWQHARRLQVRLVRRRRNWYRNLVKQLADRYGTLFFSQFEVAKLVKNASPEELEADRAKSHRAASMAATSELLRFAREKFGSWAIDADSTNLTKHCAVCGEVQEPDLEARRTGCECRRDIDENALDNTIARGQAMLANGAVAEAHAALEAKEAAKRAKLAQMQDARRRQRQAAGQE